MANYSVLITGPDFTNCYNEGLQALNNVAGPHQVIGNGNQGLNLVYFEKRPECLLTDDQIRDIMMERLLALQEQFNIVLQYKEPVEITTRLLLWDGEIRNNTPLTRLRTLLEHALPHGCVPIRNFQPYLGIYQDPNLTQDLKNIVTQHLVGNWTMNVPLTNAQLQVFYDP